MKTMKIFSLVLLSILVFAMSSCQGEKVEYRPTDGNLIFIIKQIDGKRQWGIVDPSKPPMPGENTVVAVPRQYSYRPSSATHENMVVAVPCQYDSIYSAAYSVPGGYLPGLFIGVKDEKTYAFYYTDMIGEKNFTSLTPGERKKKLHSCDINEEVFYNELQTDDGRYFWNKKWMIGPAEAILTGENFILCKRNGKWAVLYDEGKERDKHDLDNGEYIYDAVICVGESYFWVKKDGKWFATDGCGVVINKPRELVNKYLQLPIAKSNEIRWAKRDEKLYKLSVPQAPEASYIYVPPTRRWNTSW